MTLASSIARAVAGEGGFALHADGADARPTSADFSAARAVPVLWPLANTPDGVFSLLRALADGVVPIIVPSTWPRARITALRERYSRFGVFEKGGITLPPEPANAASPVALALLTSGSTGEPRVLAASLEGLDRGIMAIHASQGLDDMACTAALLPLAYSVALVNQLLWSVRHERRLVLTAGLAMPADALRQVREAGADMLCLVAHQARLLARYGFGADDALPSVRVVNFAGSPFPTSSFDFLRLLFPNAALLNNYGCAEAMPRLAVRRVREAQTDGTWVGPAIPGIELRIDGDDAVGPILFRGPSASLGTLGADGALHDHPAWIASGDLGRLDADGLHVLGRHDQVVKIFGERVSLVEVERALLAAGAHEALAWLGVDARGESAVNAIVGGTPAPPADAVQRAFAANLARTLWPQEVWHVADWPTLANGKTDQVQLKTLAAGGALPRVWWRRG
jgi:long-chain acyl-CoA synthetase